MAVYYFERLPLATMTNFMVSSGLGDLGIWKILQWKLSLICYKKINWKILRSKLCLIIYKMESVIDIATQLEPGIGQETASVEAIPSPSPIPVVDDTPADPAVAGQTANVEANSRKRKEYVQRSVVWDHFESIKDGKGVIMQAKCKYCARIYNCNAKKNGTSTLRTHMMKCTKHPHSMETRQALLSFQPVSNVGLAGGSEMFSLTAWKFDQDLVRQALAYMIVVDELPFKFVEKEGFRKLMSVACPIFKIPSRFTVNRDCYSMFVEEKLKLKKIFKTSTQRVSLTSDCWTSNQRLNYMCITAHYIDHDWKLNKKTISFVPCSKHKDEYLSKAMEACLQEWGVKNIFSVTLDNAENNTAAMTFFMKKMLSWGTTPERCKYAHMRCIAHIVNLVVSDGMKESSSLFEKVRMAVRYIKNSPLRLSKFKECKLSTETETKRSLCLDVPTRWNSTYLMLSTALLYQKVFEEYEDVESSFKKDLGDDVPSFSDWENVRELCSMLECFYKMTLRISGSLYVTAKNHLNEISDVCTILQDWMASTDVSVRLMGTRMKAKFDKYWGDPLVMNKMIFFANILDPRDRIMYMEYTLKQMYGSVNGKFLFTSLVHDLSLLFDDYDVQYKKELAGTGQSSSPSKYPGQFSQATSVLKERFMQQMMETGCVGGSQKTELDIYLSEAVVLNNDKFDILSWWKFNSQRFPVLSRMARDILAVPVSTVASESAFSTGGRVLDDFRSCLTPKIVEALICTQDWLRDPSKPVSVEQTLEELEELEEGFQDAAND
ncbi:zinc finger BED domain-containing protein RICESLEEPER 2-like [Mercurialis annua]|uniref:zinc finger BED domain-containing protein RICESLEEPER 2-like n=1 Tax=Mercurialis annua TaxID=3986 RepID=UPI0024AF3016|nr:zinc finger BED domain-containing protein RICESLEEPER 2-like [Mercurialis annua]